MRTFRAARIPIGTLAVVATDNAAGAGTFRGLRPNSQGKLNLEFVRVADYGSASERRLTWPSRRRETPLAYRLTP